MTAARWIASPVNSCGKGMVIEPRAHFALMREPLLSVAGRYLVWIDCMVFCSLGLIDRYNLPFPIGWRGESGEIE